DLTVKTSTSHLMWLNNTDTVVHRAALSQISYNATVEYPANGTSTTVSHIWSNEVINILYPSGYNITKVLINSTSSGTITLWQSDLNVPAAFEKTSCQNIPCSQSLLALNMSYINPRFIHNFNLPSDCGFNGELCARDWNFSAVFTSGFDLGIRSGLFRIDSLQVSFTGSTGGNNALSIQGRLTYGNGTKKASGVNATMFAID